MRIVPRPVTSEVYSGMSKLTRTWLCAAEMINLVRLQFVDQLHQIDRIAQVAVVQEQPDAVDMRIGIKVIDARRVERAGAPNDAVNFVAFFEEQISEVAAILPGDPGDQMLSSFAKPRSSAFD